MKTIYEFGPGRADGTGDMKDVLGGKGAGLADMCRKKLPVPPGFTIATTVCPRFYAAGKRVPKDVVAGAKKAIARLEKEQNRGFGDPARPLLVSVRSGAAVSMPGMMDTVLNLGLSASCVDGLAKMSGSRRFALDARRRFLQMFGDVVAGVDHDRFEHALAEAKADARVSSDADLSESALEQLVDRYLAVYRDSTGEDFPEDPYVQLERAVGAVFGSWESDRAVKYRKIHGITGLRGTAVTVQAMVFGNLGPTSGTGVAFTRDPSTGENRFYGEFLMNAQGEDVVAGIRTPESIEKLAGASPAAHERLLEIRDLLERSYRDMQDIEFTIEDGRLFMLQTRRGKRTTAAVRVAFDMANEGLISREEAVARISPSEVDRLLHPSFDPAAPRTVIARGLPASPGAVTGKVVFHAEDAEKKAGAGEHVILVRNETSPEDIGGMHAAQGILTATGGMTSHAAVVARGMGKCCVAGAGTVRIDYEGGRFTAGDAVIREGDVISLDGSAGEVMKGSVPTLPAALTPEFETLLRWADEIRTLGVRTNGDTPTDARVARGFGAEGIGLCRTEHMFFEGDRITAVREMILAETLEARQAALDKLLPMQRSDFEGIFEAMGGRPVTIRLLDPPLHEFLPHEPEAVRTVAKSLGVSEAVVRDRARRLHEMNPMLGHRGCRLGITFPEIYEMQVRAIYQAAEAETKRRRPVRPEVMIPLVGAEKEFTILRDRLKTVAEETLSKSARAAIPLVFGTMIEVPRAALRAEGIAKDAEFFSFGTNDLTQMTFGYSRDDAGSFLPAYVEKGILPEDPFQSLDQEGVGELIRMAVQRGRKSRPKLKVGICGEHGGDPKSIDFCHRAGLDYVSCSPYRVPVARIAAAHAAMAARGGPKKPPKGPAKTPKRTPSPRSASRPKSKGASGAPARGEPSPKAKPRPAPAPTRT